jgi:hypothetical protein
VFVCLDVALGYWGWQSRTHLAQPLVVCVGHGHVEVRVHGVEWVAHDEDGPAHVEATVPIPLRPVGLDDPRPIVHHTLALYTQPWESL